MKSAATLSQIWPEGSSKASKTGLKPHWKHPGSKYRNGLVTALQEKDARWDKSREARAPRLEL